MSKVRIYLPQEKIKETIEIKDKDILHKLKDVLRFKENRDFYLFDGKGKEYCAEILEIKKCALKVKVKGTERGENLSRDNLSLGFPLEREEKVDFILQKATELGVCAFYPFISERSLKVKPSAAKFKRWQRIIIEATRQSERLWLPKLHETIDFNQVLKLKFKNRFFGEISGKEILKMDKEKGESFFIIGPTGDFTPNEYACLKGEGFIGIKLSKNLLKTETAAILGAGLIKLFLK